MTYLHALLVCIYHFFAFLALLAASEASLRGNTHDMFQRKLYRRRYKSIEIDFSWSLLFLIVMAVGIYCLYQKKKHRNADNDCDNGKENGGADEKPSRREEGADK